MFNDKDEYSEATKNASINRYDNEKSSNKKLIILNLFLVTTLTCMGYIGFNSFLQEKNPLKKTSVMGVTHMNDDLTLINMLNNVEVDTVIEKKDNLQDAIDTIVSSSSSSGDSYIKLLKNEVSGDKSIKSKTEKILTIVVKKGDTLASISEEYYGDASEYKRIINANSSLTLKNHTIYAGQSINLPY